MNIFYSALTTDTGKEEAFSNLYKDSISLYGKEPSFEFLINIFIKSFKNLELCGKLFEEFKNTLKKVEQKNDKITDNKNLLNLKEKFQEIHEMAESDKSIKENPNMSVDYYGLILCYDCNYDFPHFSELVKHIYAQDSEILFKILLTYKRYFKGDLKIDEKILDEFIKYSAGNSYKDLTEGGLIYLKSFKLFLKIIVENEDKIFKIQNFKAIPTNGLENKIDKNNIKEIMNLVEKIIEKSQEKNKLLIVFNNKFWEKAINICNSSTQEYILLLSDLRTLFENYFSLLTNIYQKGDILDNAKALNKKDIFDLKLHNNIMEYLKHEKNDSNIDIINLIMKRDPIYFTEKNIDKRDFKILLEKIDFEKIDDSFIECYRGYDFEKIFKKKITDYLGKLFEKAKSWNLFYIVYNLIKEENIEKGKIKDLFIYINNTYDKLIKQQKNAMAKLSEEEQKKLVETISEITVFNNENKKDFFKRINQLDEELQNKIYLELYSKYDKHQEIIDKSKEFFINNIKFKNLDRFFGFVRELKPEDENDVMDILNNKYLIDEKDFYSARSDNLKIILLSKLNKEKLKNESNKYYDNSKPIIENIYNEIGGKKVTFSQLKSLFECKEEEFIKEKINLFTLIKDNFEMNGFYEELKNSYVDINEKLKLLKYIWENLEKYFSTDYGKLIQDIKNSVSNIEKGSLEYYEDNKAYLIPYLEKKDEADEVNKVKRLQLFTIIYRHTKGNNQKEHFENALQKLDKIDSILKSNDDNKDNKSILEEIKQNNAKIDEEIKTYFTQKNSDRELSLLVHFDAYEKDIQSIFYFFDNLKNDENWNKIFCPKYKDISKENIEEYLKELKEKNIYNYEIEGKQKSYYIKFFNYLYQKQQAIDFLIQKHENLNLLYEQLDPNNQTIQAKDIDDTIICVKFFEEIKNIEKNEGNEKVFHFIKEKFQEKGSDNLINSFKCYSYAYPTIIEMNQSFDDFSLSLFDEVKIILKKTDIIFKQHNEEIKILEKDTKSKGDKINIESLNDIFTLKNKINVQPKKIAENYSENEITLIKKNNTLLFFKDIVNKIESIYEHMTVLRKKGSILSIRIKIEIETKKNYKNEDDTNVKYYLNDYNGKEIEKTFDFIEKFLSNAKKDFIKQLEQFFKEYDFMRFFYGSQFVTIVNHLNGNRKIIPFLRYILNETDNTKEIKTGDTKNQHCFNNFIKDYKDYHRETFENIVEYVITLFRNNNNSSIEKHYEKMSIKKGNENKTELKGIYIYESQSESMEEDILQIFLDKIGSLPIAQNVLITSKETSYEEMQVFFNRAILCKYNALFVAEINESFSESQQRYLNRFIDRLLFYLSEKNENSDKKDTKQNMESCLVFICNEKTKSVLEYIKKTVTTYPLDLKKFHNLNSSIIPTTEDNTLSRTDNLNTSRDLLNENIHVIKSEICGLGKTEKIKKEIKKKGKVYIHFPVGGSITRDILFSKLNIILKKVEEKKVKENEIAAVHLDLYENNEPSILNEFLFSFLITKFYLNNEDVLYIPIDLEIFIEIPNCFEDFLSKYKILKAFEIENITLDSKPKLDLPEDKCKHFENMLELHGNEEISEYINKFFDISKHSYHQLTIFINLFISQYSKSKDKRTFYIGDKIVTEQVIQSFKNCTKYFTEGSFANLLTDPEKMEKMKSNNEEYKQILEELYENDLENQEFKYPLIFRNPKPSGTSYFYILSIKKDYIGLTDFDDSKESYSSYKHGTSEYYLFLLKNILELETSVQSLKEIIDKDKYVLTSDNFRKMTLIIYRITANIPVILMGETGCGKTSLIRKLNQLLNNGEEKLEFINIHPGITDAILKDEITRINNKAKNLKENLWIFFDEINTCNSFALLTEIFINRSFESEKLCDNIRIIGACNPYRIRKKDKIICGLSYPDDFNDNKKDYVYLVNMLPQSLMYFIFNFGSINDEDEKKYIKSIISKNFNKEEDRNKYIENIISGYSNQKEKAKNYINSLIMEDFDEESDIIEIYEDFQNSKEMFLKNNISKNQHKNQIVEKYISKLIAKYYDKNITKNIHIPNLIYDSKNEEPNINMFIKNLISEHYEKKKEKNEKGEEVEKNKYINDLFNNYKNKKDKKTKELINNLFSEYFYNMKYKDEIDINNAKDAKEAKDAYIINLINNYKGNDSNTKTLINDLIFEDYEMKKNEKKEIIDIYKDYSYNKNQQKLMKEIDTKFTENENVKNYIKKLISNDFNKKDQKLKDITKDIISGCHKYLRKILDPSCVSLREISRFSKCLVFFIEYFRKKNKYYKKMMDDKITNESGKSISKDNYLKLFESYNDITEKIKSIIISIYICYYIRLTLKADRDYFDNDEDLKMKVKFLRLINFGKYDEERGSDDLFDSIENKDFKDDIMLNGITQLKVFNQILELEEEFILDKIELDKGIGNSRALRENLFLLFISLGTSIPLIIIGKPGSGKSLSSHLIYNSMKGKYSQNHFFQLYPSIIQIYFQGSKSVKPEDVEKIFNTAERKLDNFKEQQLENVPRSMLLFDELGLAERSKYNPLKVLHKKLDDYFNEHTINNDDNSRKVVFVGITNWNLDAAKLNRALSLSVPDLDEDMNDLRETSINIANSFNPNFADKKILKDNKDQNKVENENEIQIFEDLLPLIYYYYKKCLKDLKNYICKKIYLSNKNEKAKTLGEIKKEDDFKKIYAKEKKIKINFHGNRDFFNLVKGVARDLNETNEIAVTNSVVNLIEKYLERNFGGMDIDIDINEKDIEGENVYLKNIVKLNKKSITSVEFIKCIYNTFFNEKEDEPDKYKDYKLKKTKSYNIIKCIYDNVQDENSRYLLLGIEPSIAILIYQNVKKKMNLVKSVNMKEGSPFLYDENMEYQYSVLSDIEGHAKNENNILFLQNLDHIYPYLYDLFNMNYLIKDGKPYARISHGSHNTQLVLIDKSFRIVIMVDKKKIPKMESPFLNRFEKIII